MTGSGNRKVRSPIVSNAGDLLGCYRGISAVPVMRMKPRAILSQME